MELHRVAKWSSFGNTGWEQVRLMCLDYWVDPPSNIQNSIGWRLVAVDDDYYYLQREKDNPLGRDGL